MEAEEDIDNIFEDYESRENDGETNGTGINQESNNDTPTGIRVEPTKRIVRNPRAKFDPDRLCGERGIPILMDHFKDVKFKGKGHEKEDLDKLLTKLEHWTHRLFPSMKFEDCLYQIEKLGKKRQVQTCVRKIRLDMPILASDFVKDNEDDDVQRNEDVVPEEIDAFDKLVGENQNFNPLNTVDSEVDSTFSVLSPPSQGVPTSALGGHVLGSAGSSLTEEQKERLERNRMLAVERRKAKLASIQQNATESVPECNEETSQEDSITLPSDSPKRNKMIIPDALLANSSHSDNNENDDSSELNNQNSDNLGLDDLIDLVDKEVNFDKIANLSSEQSTKICIETIEELPQSSMSSNLKETVSCRALDSNSSNMTTTSNTLGFTEGKNLKLGSLMDLINDNSEKYQQDSDLLETVKHNSDSKNLISGEEMSTTMDCEDEKLLKEFGSDSSSLVIVEDPSMEIL